MTQTWSFGLVETLIDRNAFLVFEIPQYFSQETVGRYLTLLRGSSVINEFHNNPLSKLVGNV